MKKRSELFFRVLLLPIDYFMIAAAFAAAFLVRHEQSKPLAYLVNGKSFLRIILPVLVLWLVIYAFAGLYKLRATRSRLHETSRVIMASAVGVMLLIIIDFFAVNPIFPSKAIPIYAFVFAVLFVSNARFIIYALQHYLFRYKIGVHNTLILGKGSSRVAFAAVLQNESPAYRIVENVPIRYELSSAFLTASNKQHALDDIFLLEEGVPQGTVTKLINFCRQNQLQLHIIPTVAELYGAQMRMSRIKNLPILEIVSTPLDGWGRIMKRVFDLVLLVPALIISLPIMLVVAVFIKLTDTGPVFYGHERLTRSGKKIRVLKFRTMKQAYCTGGKYSEKSDIEVLKTFGDPLLIEEFQRDQKVKNDPRVSKVGKFLRASSLDELPQLLNVIKSELSFVGPRPIVEAELERYGDESGLFLHIKPGITGLWQVSGRNDIIYDQRVKLDIYYIENWSIWLDIAIILRTIPVILLRKSGY
ncbi:sugar transferase [Candidatus Saccharibacteria bacterium]|nr:sugar transferase [Candidatus Saccharibacteria bacterium]